MKEERKDCEHEDFKVVANIARMGDTFPMAFVAEIGIACVDCGERFRFIGVPAGAGFKWPLVAVDGCTLNAPIEPEGRPRLMRSAVIEMLPKEGKSS